MLLKGDIANNGGTPFSPDTDYVFGYLPEGYRPGGSAAWIACCMRAVNSTEINIPCAVLIKIDGEVSIHTPANVATEAVVCLSGVFFTSAT